MLYLGQPNREQPYGHHRVWSVPSSLYTHSICSIELSRRPSRRYHALKLSARHFCRRNWYPTVLASTPTSNCAQRLGLTVLYVHHYRFPDHRHQANNGDSHHLTERSDHRGATIMLMLYYIHNDNGIRSCTPI